MIGGSRVVAPAAQASLTAWHAQIVKCCAHFRERIQLMHDNAYKFNGPDGPEAQNSPIKSATTEGDEMQASGWWRPESYCEGLQTIDLLT